MKSPRHYFAYSVEGVELRDCFLLCFFVCVAIEIRWFEAIHANISSGGLLGLRVESFL